MLFLYKFLFPKRKQQFFAYLPILKNIETFPETNHLLLFFWGLREKLGNFGFSQGNMEGMRKVKEFQNFPQTEM